MDRMDLGYTVLPYSKMEGAEGSEHYSLSKKWSAGVNGILTIMKSDEEISAC